MNKGGYPSLFFLGHTQNAKGALVARERDQGMYGYREEVEKAEKYKKTGRQAREF
jgi:hypothetical protein